MTTPIPLITPYCPPRSRQNYLDAIASLDVEHNPIYQAGYLVAGVTWCNRFLTDATRLLDCEIPFAKANDQVIWLAGMPGAAAGWLELHDLSMPQGLVSRETQAIARVELGLPTVAVWSNPKPADHGHVGMVVPTLPPSTGVHVAAAGSHNFQNAAVSRSFGVYVPRYFTHV
jgi:hypothetical protein